MKSGTLLRQVINKINQEIDFNAAKTRHIFGELYEGILKDLQAPGMPVSSTHLGRPRNLQWRW